jgi:hypothetical protein|tara:strand:+ start:1075 stop:1446 length:372 start_codon:yes stop_codon:yes gene_type:complete
MARTLAEIIHRCTNYLWQEELRKPYYRIQTNDHRIARKMKRKTFGQNLQKVVQVIFGINVPLWVFQIQYKSPHIAKKSFGRIMGAEVQKTPENGLFVAYTLPPSTIQTNNPKLMNPLREHEDV